MDEQFIVLLKAQMRNRAGLVNIKMDLSFP